MTSALQELKSQLKGRVDLTDEGSRAIAAMLHPPSRSDNPGYPDADNTASIRTNGDLNYTIQPPSALDGIESGKWNATVMLNPNCLEWPIIVVKWKEGCLEAIYNPAFCDSKSNVPAYGKNLYWVQIVTSSTSGEGTQTQAGGLIFNNSITTRSFNSSTAQAAQYKCYNSQELAANQMTDKVVASIEYIRDPMAPTWGTALEWRTIAASNTIEMECATLYRQGIIYGGQGPCPIRSDVYLGGLVDYSKFPINGESNMIGIEQQYQTLSGTVMYNVDGSNYVSSEVFNFNEPLDTYLTFFPTAQGSKFTWVGPPAILPPGEHEVTTNTIGGVGLEHFAIDPTTANWETNSWFRTDTVSTQDSPSTLVNNAFYQVTAVNNGVDLDLQGYAVVNGMQVSSIADNSVTAMIIGQPMTEPTMLTLDGVVAGLGTDLTLADLFAAIGKTVSVTQPNTSLPALNTSDFDSKGQTTTTKNYDYLVALNKAGNIQDFNLEEAAKVENNYLKGHDLHQYVNMDYVDHWMDQNGKAIEARDAKTGSFYVGKPVGVDVAYAVPVGDMIVTAADANPPYFVLQPGKFSSAQTTLPVDRNAIQCLSEMHSHEADKGSFQIARLYNADNPYVRAWTSGDQAVGGVSCFTQGSSMPIYQDYITVPGFRSDVTNLWVQNEQRTFKPWQTPGIYNEAARNQYPDKTPEVSESYVPYELKQLADYALGTYHRGEFSYTWGTPVAHYSGMLSAAVLKGRACRDLEILPIIGTSLSPLASTPCRPDTIAIATGLTYLNEVPVLMTAAENSWGNFLSIIKKVGKAALPVAMNAFPALKTVANIAHSVADAVTNHTNPDDVVHQKVNHVASVVKNLTKAIPNSTTNKLNPETKRAIAQMPDKITNTGTSSHAAEAAYKKALQSNL